MNEKHLYNKTMGNSYSAPPINLANPEGPALLLPSQKWLIIGGYFSIALLFLFGIAAFFVDIGILSSALSEDDDDIGNAGKTASIVTGVIVILLAIGLIFVLRWYKKKSLNRYVGKLEVHCPKEDFMTSGELNKGSYRNCLNDQRNSIDSTANTTATGLATVQAVSRRSGW